MKQISRQQLDSLAETAAQSPRRRANLNLHDTLDDPIQRLAIAMEPDTEVLPHRHPHTWELLTPLKGRFVVLHFDEAGSVTQRTVLGEDSQVVETPAGTWHAVLSLDEGGVIFEVKHGPYKPIATEDIAPWQACASTEQLLAWYSMANMGERFLLSAAIKVI
ncbi:MAG TPA: WbuC family cupin fold metalloprotein [Rhodocyclaceae bacterium]|jgi:cupin fold WbuC family metalloprotein|nr:WbuC family cupin fold metalloprotein [Rhodocyclaceae bacterium]